MTPGRCLSCGTVIPRHRDLCRSCDDPQSTGIFKRLPPREVPAWEEWEHCNACGGLRGTHDASCREVAA